MFKALFFFVFCLSTAHANGLATLNSTEPLDLSQFLTSNLESSNDYDTPTFMDEFDPHSPDAEEILKAYDEYYRLETGEEPYVTEERFTPASSCYRERCKVWAKVSKAEQKLHLYLDGRLAATWLVSTGLGSRTPNMDSHPNGRIYDVYTSRTYRGGNYNGLGNMPYAVFIKHRYPGFQSPFAIHGTVRSNWPLLGRKASKGCIRLHPDNAFRFNRLVRSAGIHQTWITVQ